ncbi:hypothetical protein [Sporolactobacillus vineae]|uniref:hypothetical protein n=1 Tax=Sporolactobacillus vineae TaxID=444463 RepID=UPI00028A0CD0|nr:hypothetical protein [Sporolactobacillus vineae]
MRKLIYLSTLSFILLVGILILTGRFSWFGSRPAITWFPESEQIVFEKAETRLRDLPDSDQIEWTVDSQLQNSVYLIQHFSLLYKNNRLVGMINHWKNNEQSLSDRRTPEAVPGFYQSLTVHQGELHSDDKIFGKEILSESRLFLYQDGEIRHAFTVPKDIREKKMWAGYMKGQKERQKQLIFQAQKIARFNPADYRIVPLSELTEQSISQLFPFGKVKAERITGRLWEGIYRMIVGGIETQQGRTVPAAGSTMPLLLIGKDHLLLIVETADHQIVLLKQLF